MQNNIIWEGINDESVENCNVLTNEDGMEANATVSLLQDDYVCNIEYFVKINRQWESRYLKIVNCHEEGNKELELQRLPGNKWMVNGKEDAAYEGFDGIYISVTPFTNTFIINRKKLQEEESIKMRIIYIEPLEMRTEPIEVVYTKLTEREFEYQNLTTGYNVVLDVDENGLVTNYPGYFKMLG